MSKFTYAERESIKSTVAILTIKRIPDKEIIRAIAEQTNKTMTIRHLTRVKQQIKRESFKWYSELREGEYEYLHEFKERINEIMAMQKKLHEIIDDNEDNPSIQLDAISELHKLTITLSNLYDVAPVIVNGFTLSTTQQSKAPTEDIRDEDIIV
jgi:hypothetical protein